MDGFGDDSGTTFINNASSLLDMGRGMGLDKKVTTVFDRIIDMKKLKHYFHVDNKYVLHKLKILALPFLHKNWARLPNNAAPGGGLDDGAGGSGSGSDGLPFRSPKEDINAPDLYIPTMAFLTYIIFCSFAMGVNGQFTPDVFGRTASSGLAALAVEVMFIKLGFYLVSARASTSLYDLVCYCGYKYLWVIVNMAAGLFLPGVVYYAAVLATSALMALFMFRALKLEILPQVSHGAPGGNGGASSPRAYFLIVVAAAQLPLIYFQS